MAQSWIANITTGTRPDIVSGLEWFIWDFVISRLDNRSFSLTPPELDFQIKIKTLDVGILQATVARWEETDEPGLADKRVEWEDEKRLVEDLKACRLLVNGSGEVLSEVA